MSVEISSIGGLKTAAEKADLNNNGKIDKEEISVFEEEALKLNVDKSIVISICESASKDSKEYIEEMEKSIDSLKEMCRDGNQSELETLSELIESNESLKIAPKNEWSDTSIPLLKYLGASMGSAIGTFYTLDKLNSWPLKKGLKLIGVLTTLGYLIGRQFEMWAKDNDFHLEDLIK